MMIAMLIILGLAFGSFVNALVWRVHQQSLAKKPRGKNPKLKAQDLSILKGRSMCPHCKHTLAWHDLIPIFSWLSLKGKCRYCKKSISWQYPVVELSTAALFVISYIFWPFQLLSSNSYLLFAAWLVSLVLLIALFVYDIKWMLLPNRLVFPLIGIAGLDALLRASEAENPLQSIVNSLAGVAIASGIFYVLFQVSNGKWIGGGDVKLGIALGLLVGSAPLAFLLLFTASILGLSAAIPQLIQGKAKMTSKLPFGPFLIAATVIVVLFGQQFVDWYANTFLLI